MDDINSRQERMRNTLNRLNENPLITSITLRMFPSELKRAQKDFPNLDFEVDSTRKTPTSKMHEVTVTKK